MIGKERNATSADGVTPFKAQLVAPSKNLKHLQNMYNLYFILNTFKFNLQPLLNL